MHFSLNRPAAAGTQTQGSAQTPRRQKSICRTQIVPGAQTVSPQREKKSTETHIRVDIQHAADGKSGEILKCDLH